MRSLTSLIGVIALLATSLPSALAQTGTARYEVWSASTNCDFGRNYLSSAPSDGTCTGSAAANTISILCNGDGSWRAQEFASAQCGSGIPIYDISGSGTGCTAGNSYSIKVDCNGQAVTRNAASMQAISTAVIVPTLLLTAGYVLHR